MADDYEPKISGAAALTGGLLLGIVDIVEFAFGLFGIDDFGVSDIICFPVTQLYLRYKGARGLYSAIGNTIEIVPYVGPYVPTKSIGWWMTIWIDRHPEGSLAKVQKLVPKINASTPAKAMPAPARR